MLGSGYLSRAPDTSAPPPQVRSLWSSVDEVVSSIKAEQDGVERVLRGEVDQYVLDGTDQVLKVPRVLQEQVERLPQVRVVLVLVLGRSDPVLDVLS